MSFATTAAFLGALALVSRVSAHGTVSSISVDGQEFPGYSPSFQYQQTPPVVAGWSIPQDLDNGFVSDYTNNDMICHKGATPGQGYVEVAAGGEVTLQWTTWPESHHGPVIDYLANCNGECTTVDKTSLLFNKIDERGLVSYNAAPGIWASDELIADGNKWTVTIPSSVAPGNYVLRHEMIALHSAYDQGAAQNYPQCINLKVTGSGSDSLASGTKGTALYTATDPGILINIYNGLEDYVIPGPELLSGSSSGAKPAVSVSASPPVSSAVAPVSSAVAPVLSAVAPVSTATPTSAVASSAAAPTSTVASSTAAVSVSSAVSSAVAVPSVSSVSSAAVTVSAMPTTFATVTKPATTAAATTSAAAGTAQTPYGQCGGINWTGATTCASGWTCAQQNPYYFQCREATAATPTASADECEFSD